MATVTLRPDGVVATSPDLPPLYGMVVGSTAYHTAANDNSDATYVRFPDNGSYWSVEYSFATVAIPAGAQIRSVTPRVRHNNANPVNTIRGFTLLTGGNAFPTDALDWVTGLTTQAGAARTELPGGGAWTQAAVDGLSMRVSKLIVPTYAPQFDVSEVYIDVVYNAAPVISITAPSTVQGTSRPVVAWNYTDAEGDVQEAFRVKTFTQAQFSAGGFDPNTTTPFHDSGVVSSSATSWQYPIDLTNGGNYTTYVQASDAGSNGRWSGLSVNGPKVSVAISLTAPNAPTLSVAPLVANNGYRLTITAANNINPATTYRFSVERYDAINGVWQVLTRLWSTVGNGTADYASLDFATTASPTLTVDDYEVRRGTLPQYRVRVLATKSGNNLISPYSTTVVPATALPAAGWRLVPVNSPTTGIALNVHSETLSWESQQRQSIVYALGRSNPIVLIDAIAGETLDLELSMLSQNDYDAFERLRKLADTMLLQTSYGDHRYVRFGGGRGASHMLTGGGVRKYVVKVNLVEVDG